MFGDVLIFGEFLVYLFFLKVKFEDVEEEMVKKKKIILEEINNIYGEMFLLLIFLVYLYFSSFV